MEKVWIRINKKKSTLRGHIRKIAKNLTQSIESEKPNFKSINMSFFRVITNNNRDASWYVYKLDGQDITKEAFDKIKEIIGAINNFLRKVYIYI